MVRNFTLAGTTEWLIPASHNGHMLNYETTFIVFFQRFQIRKLYAVKCLPYYWGRLSSSKFLPCTKQALC